MKKCYTWCFLGALILLLVLTCIFGVRGIGKDLFGFASTMKSRNIIENIDALFDTVDVAVTDNFILRDECVNIYGLIQRIVGKSVVEDATPDKTVIKGSDGNLYFRGAVTDEINSDSSYNDNRMAMDQNIASVANLKEYCEQLNVELLYVTAPHKYYSGAVSLPEARYDFYNDTIYFADELEKNGVNNINLMDELIESDISYSSGFFVTDHHWNIKTAFWGFQNICNALNSQCVAGIDEMLFSSDSYTTETYKDTYLGSMGVRVGKYYAGKDDIDIIAPIYDTNFIVEYNTKTLQSKIHKEGAFDTAILGDDISYNVYITSDNALVHVDNQNNPNSNKILLIKDSFGVPVSAWLACCCDDLWVMDLRYQQEESVMDFINSHGINQVVVLYNPEAMASSIFYNFDTVSKGA